MISSGAFNINDPLMHSQNMYVLQARPGGDSVADGAGAGGSVGAFKAAAAATIDEYFASGEVGEVVRRLVELDEPALSNIFVKHVRSFEAEA